MKLLISMESCRIQQEVTGFLSYRILELPKNVINKNIITIITFCFRFLVFVCCPFQGVHKNIIVYMTMNKGYVGFITCVSNVWKVMVFTFEWNYVRISCWFLDIFMCMRNANNDMKMFHHLQDRSNNALVLRWLRIRTSRQISRDVSELRCPVKREDPQIGMWWNNEYDVDIHSQR